MAGCCLSWPPGARGPWPPLHGHFQRAWHTDQPTRLLGTGQIVRVSIIDGVQSPVQTAEARFSNPFADDTRRSRSFPDGSECPHIRRQTFGMVCDHDDHGTSKSRRAASRPSRKRARAPQPPPPPPYITFTEPEPTGRDHLIRIWFDTHSKRWGFFESQVPFDAERDVPNNMKYHFNTVGDATVGALRHLEPFWGDASILWIHGGVVVPHMPRNARVTGSPGYRARIDAGLYEMNQAQLQAEHARTIRQSDGQARQTAIVTIFRLDSRLTRSVTCTTDFGRNIAGSAEHTRN